MLKKIIHYSLFLALICGISIFGVSLVYSVTFDSIQEKKQAKTQAALTVVLPNLEIADQPESFEFEGQKYNIFVGKDSVTKAPKSWAIQIGEQAYSSVIQTMIGINEENRVIAIEVVFQQETPGLGTECASTGPKKLSSIWSGKQEEIKRPWFQTQFENKGLENLELKKDIQAISGATITSAAINRSVQHAIKVVEAFRKKQD